VEWDIWMTEYASKRFFLLLHKIYKLEIEMPAVFFNKINEGHTMEPRIYAFSVLITV
jgi:hypothetical protein